MGEVLAASAYAGSNNTVALLGNSDSIQRVTDLIRQAAPSHASVLITGESGVGKCLVARTIHDSGPRSGKPFIKVSMLTGATALIDEELFGRQLSEAEPGSPSRNGCLEIANGGTLFLEEIGSLPQATQARLVRMLQEKAFERLGGSEIVAVDVRIISATSQDLEKLIRISRFRLDLYYRLNLFSIYVPPLRERKPDIPLLADHFIEKAGKKHGKRIRRISTSALDALMEYSWPGNLRELENCLERAVLLSSDGIVQVHHLPRSIQKSESDGAALPGDLRSALAAFEKEIIIDALKLSRGNGARAARLLGISERSMGLRISKYGVDPKCFKNFGKPPTDHS
jgi:Nif-specific regulatory protein